MGRWRQFVNAEPVDVVVLFRGGVAGRSPPVVNQPAAEHGLVFAGAYCHLAQVSSRVRRDVHTEFFVQLARKCSKLGLTRLDKSTGQVPYVRVRVLVRSAVDQKNLMVTGQSAEDDYVHMGMEA